MTNENRKRFTPDEFFAAMEKMKLRSRMQTPQPQAQPDSDDPEPTSDDEETESPWRIELGSWHDLKACWGFIEVHDQEGLMLCDQEGEEIGFYSESDLDRMLSRVGSMGCYFLIFSTEEWQTIPALSGDFAKLYETWGC